MVTQAVWVYGDGPIFVEYYVPQREMMIICDRKHLRRLSGTS